MKKKCWKYSKCIKICGINQRSKLKIQCRLIKMFCYFNERWLFLFIHGCQWAKFCSYPETKSVQSINNFEPKSHYSEENRYRICNKQFSHTSLLTGSQRTRRPCAVLLAHHSVWRNWFQGVIAAICYGASRNQSASRRRDPCCVHNDWRIGNTAA